MKYTSRIGDRATQAHVNYKCPCGCLAGLTFDKHAGAEHLGACCCGRLLWVGDDAGAVVSTHYRPDQEYEIDLAAVTMPWGGEVTAALAEPHSALAAEQARREAGQTLTKVVDPVCRMMFPPETAVATSRFQGTTYYFCAPRCKERFDAEPTRDVQGQTLLQRLIRR